MINTGVAVIGGGPSGLCAAISAAKSGAKVLLLERNAQLGGQLIKQTHMFFGSEKQYASYRGIDICKILEKQINELPNITVYTNATVLGMYEDGILTVEKDDKYIKIKPKSVIVATGASEKFLAFAGNDLPGVYGAGAVQTLMNVYGVKPGNEVVMVGAGNIGLIVSYQLLQAGVKVNAVIDAAPNIGGYLVHASKIARLGVPIYTSTTVKRAHGTESVCGVTTVKLDEKWQEISGSEKYIPCDNLCISVGLSPLAELLWQIGCKMKYVNCLGGYVPLRDKYLQTTVKGVFVAGDLAGIEEASSAMVEGKIAGLSAAKYCGHVKDFDKQYADCIEQETALRKSATGQRIQDGIKQVTIKGEE